MTKRELNHKLQIEANPNIYEQENAPPDYRLKMIYDRYRRGRSIILDDLKYLWIKDEEGFKKITSNIIEATTDKNLEPVANNMEYSKNNNETTHDLKNQIDYVSTPDVPINTLINFHETMASVKAAIETMSQKELLDMTKNLYNELELKKQSQKMKYWDDTWVEKMVTYTYEEEKEFNMLA